MPFSGNVDDIEKAGDLILKWYEFLRTQEGPRPPGPSDVFGYFQVKGGK